MVVFETPCPNDIKKFELEISNASFQVDVFIIEQMMPSARVVPPPYIRGILNF